MPKIKAAAVEGVENAHISMRGVRDFIAAIDNCLADNGLDLAVVKTEEANAILYQFHTEDRITVVIRLYKYFGDRQHYLLIESASGCVPRERSRVLESVLVSQNSRMASPVRLAINEAEGLVVAQMWSNTRYLNACAISDLIDLVIVTATQIKADLLKASIEGFSEIPAEWFQPNKENLH